MEKPNFKFIENLSAYDYFTNYESAEEKWHEDLELLDEVDPLGNMCLFDDFCDHFNNLCKDEQGNIYEVYFFGQGYNDFDNNKVLFWQKIKPIESFSALCRAKTTESKMSQQVVAEKTGIPLRTLENYLNNQLVPNVSKQKLVIEKLDELIKINRL